MNQLSIFELDPKQVKFEKYHAKNPEIWEAFKTLSFQLIKAGRSHFSADAILHTILIITAIRGGLDFKINKRQTTIKALWIELKIKDCKKNFTSLQGAAKDTEERKQEQ